MIEKILIESIGWVANLFFLSAYFLVSRKKISGDGKIFNFMNLTGALLYGSYATLKNALPVLVLEFFWGGIAVLALYKIYFKSQRKKKG